MSKKLAATLIATILNAVMIALNNKLALGLPESVQVAVVATSGAVLIWYLQKQGVIDKVKEENNADS